MRSTPRARNAADTSLFAVMRAASELVPMEMDQTAMKAAETSLRGQTLTGICQDPPIARVDIKGEQFLLLKLDRNSIRIGNAPAALPATVGTVYVLAPFGDVTPPVEVTVAVADVIVGTPRSSRTARAAASAPLSAPTTLLALATRAGSTGSTSGAGSTAAVSTSPSTTTAVSGSTTSSTTNAGAATTTGSTSNGFTSGSTSMAASFVPTADLASWRGSSTFSTADSPFPLAVRGVNLPTGNALIGLPLDLMLQSRPGGESAYVARRIPCGKLCTMGDEAYIRHSSGSANLELVFSAPLRIVAFVPTTTGRFEPEYTDGVFRELDTDGTFLRLYSEGAGPLEFLYFETETQGIWRLKQLFSDSRSTAWTYKPASDPTCPGCVSNVTFPDGLQQTFSYERRPEASAQLVSRATARLKAMQAPDGTAYAFGYDTDSRLTQITQTSPTARTLATISYASGLPAAVSLTDSAGTETASYTYDAGGLAQKYSDTAGTSFTVQYPAAGTAQLSLPYATSETYQWRAADSEVTSVTSGGTSSTFERALSGKGARLVTRATSSWKTLSGQQSRSTDYVYNAQNRVYQVKAGSTVLAQFDLYNAFGQAMRIVENGETTTLYYDTNGRRTAINQNSQQLATWNYTGNTSVQVSANGVSGTLTRDAAGATTAVTVAGRTATFTYDPTSRKLTGVSSPRGNLQITNTPSGAYSRSYTPEEGPLFSSRSDVDEDGRLALHQSPANNPRAKATFDANGSRLETGSYTLQETVQRGDRNVLRTRTLTTGAGAARTVGTVQSWQPPEVGR